MSTHLAHVRDAFIAARWRVSWRVRTRSPGLVRCFNLPRWRTPSQTTFPVHPPLSVPVHPLLCRKEPGVGAGTLKQMGIHSSTLGTVMSSRTYAVLTTPMSCRLYSRYPVVGALRDIQFKHQIYDSFVEYRYSGDTVVCAPRHRGKGPFPSSRSFRAHFGLAHSRYHPEEPSRPSPLDIIVLQASSWISCSPSIPT